MICGRNTADKGWPMSLDVDLFKSRLYIIKKLQRNALKRYDGYLKGRLLDLGCGTGPYRKYSGCDHYIGLDECPAFNPDVIGSLPGLPFKGASFDSIICNEVLEHLKEPQEALKEMLRVIRRGGAVYVTVPMTWSLHYEPEDYFRFTGHGIMYLLERAGFKVIAVERIGGIFSMIGQRFIDVYWHFAVRILKPICGVRWAERAACVLALPFSVFFYILGLIGDRIDKRDALGWAALATKESP